MAVRGDQTNRLTVPIDPKAPLTPEERRLQERLFGNTETFPDSYKSWLPEYAAQNSPPIPTSNVTGARAGVWRAWVPEWTSSGTQPVLSNGTLTGRYAINGQVVTAALNLTAGSSTTFGTGDWKFSLPTEIGGGGFFYTGGGRAFDNSAGGRYAVAATVDATNLMLPFDATASPGSRLAAAVPFTWAQNDNLYLQVTYEILR